MAAKPQGTINVYMNYTDNPLKDLPAKAWKPKKLSKCSTTQQFNREFRGCTKRLIAKSGQSTIYALDDPKSSKKGFIVKYYNLSDISWKRVWQEFILVKRTNLLCYNGIYYIKETNQIKIIFFI